MSQRKPEEILKILEDQALEDEIEEVAKMSDAQLDDALRVAGIAPNAVRAAGREIGTQATRGAPQQAPPEAWVSAPPTAPSRSVGAWWRVPLAAALAAAAIAATIYAAGHMGQRDASPIEIGPDGSSTAPAERIRVSALEACDRGQWQECVDGLSVARSLDPAGDADPRVQAAWRAARAALEHDRPAAPHPDSKTLRPPLGPDKK
jgi:hypothetical protein